MRRLVDRSVAWANRSTVAVGCLGGSGSRGLAELLFRHGVYMGHCLNPSTMDCAYFAVHDRPPLAQVMQSVFTGPASAGSLDYQLHQLPAAVLAAAERHTQACAVTRKDDLPAPSAPRLLATAGWSTICLCPALTATPQAQDDVRAK